MKLCFVFNYPLSQIKLNPLDSFNSKAYEKNTYTLSVV